MNDRVGVGVYKLTRSRQSKSAVDGDLALEAYVPGQGLWLAAACRVGRGLEAVPRREGLLTVSIRRNVERSVCQIVARTPLIETH